jgi:hypothetical protein
MLSRWIQTEFINIFNAFGPSSPQKAWNFYHFCESIALRKYIFSTDFKKRLAEEIYLIFIQ